MASVGSDEDSPLAAPGGGAQAAAREPLLNVSAKEDLLRENDHSYTEFYARLGTHEDELALSGGGGDDPMQHRESESSSQDQESVGLIPDRDSLTDTSTGRRTFVRRPKTQCPRAMTTGIVATAILLMVILLWWVSGGSKSVSPPNWTPASKYEVSFIITLSSGLEEPGIVMVDQDAQAMRASYYSGMNTYIFNKTGTSWAIIPRIDKLACFEEPPGVPLPAVFPDLKRFKYVGQREIIVKTRRGSDMSQLAKKGKMICAEWRYKAPPKGDDDGYQGVYTIWTRPGSNNLPVRMLFTGRSTILGSSHFDNFTIDYFNYRDLSTEGGVDPFWLRPPKGMPCSPATNASSSSLSDQAQRWSLLFPEADEERDEVYRSYRLAHSTKEYSEARKMLFHQSLRLIQAHNLDASKSYKLGLNKFADWTAEERVSIAHTGMKRKHWADLPVSRCKIESLDNLKKEFDGANLPKEVDFHKKGLVRDPSEQGACGASWANAVTGVLEAKIASKLEKSPIALSAQNLIDCAGFGPLAGLICEVGVDYAGYNWIIENNEGHLATESSYPRLDQIGFCHFDAKRKLSDGAARFEADAPKMTDCVHVTDAYSVYNTSSQYSSEDLMKVFNLRLNTHGPLAVNVDISPHDFFLYSSGIYHNPDCKSDAPSLDHSMLAVGYELDESSPVTVVRNTWGKTWGELGYARILQTGNICGVATAASYVQVG